jgi:hypothetical protein
MNFIQRQQIDCKKWNKLVDNTANATVYNKSFFLDVVSENWCIYVDENYTKGLAIPFTQKLNCKSVYTPNFLRCLNFLGDINQEFAIQVIEAIKGEFLVGNLSLEGLDIYLEGEMRVYQKISSFEDHSLNNLSNRMIKKFSNSGLRISEDVKIAELLTFLEFNLFTRIDGLNKSDFLIFKKLITSLNEMHLLKSYVACDIENNLKGCVLLIQTSNNLTYIKGVSSSESMKQGVMYGLMNHAFSLAKDNKLIFDFGGSNVDSIRQFYTNLGGRDANYVRIKWGEFPIYYKIAKYIYHFIGKLKK